MPKFSKRHYEAIADVLADSGLHIRNNGREQIENVKNGLADLFGKDNPRFKRDRFMRACQWQPNRLAA